MSFFDEDDEPPRRAPRPRRPAPAGGPVVDQQTLWARRGVAIGVGILILVLLVLGVDSCRDTARKNSLKDYNREVTALVQQSDNDVGANFFEQLRQVDADSPGDLQDAISSLRVQSETLIEQAENVDTPDELVPAQRSLLIAFDLRRDGLDFIAKRVAIALGDPGDRADEAFEQIAGQMQAFLASDVLIEARVTPLVKKVLDESGIGGQKVVSTERFLNDFAWLAPSTLATRLGGELSEGGTNRNPNEPTGPGRHGTGMDSVSVGDLTLNPETANRVKVGPNLIFAVKFTNQGENDEFDVKVSITLKGPGRAIRASKTVDTIAKGQPATANLTLPRAPTPGEVYSVTVRVAAVPGEQLTDNNTRTYQVLFEQ